MNPSLWVDIFVGHLYYPSQVALQQSLLPFIQTRQNSAKKIIQMKNVKNKQTHFCPLEQNV